ncbi:MAG: hypothetical protein GY898_16645 [Proteobacteria bacterium]|nr:hypothetical protein [Pseudomonadota bacterium]
MAEPRQQILVEPSFSELIQSDRFVRLSAGAPIDAHALRLGLTPEGPRVEVLRLWPRPSAWARHEDQLWLPTDPEVLLGPGLPQELDRYDPLRDCSTCAQWVPSPADAARELVPADVLELVQRFDPSVQFDVLRLLEAVPWSRDLAADNPALAALLARSVPGELPAGFEEVGDLLQSRRTELLAYLDLPPRRWVERTLRAVRARDFDADLLAGLAALVGRADRGEVRLLQHLRPLRWHVLEVLVDGVAMLAATPALLRQAVGLRPDDLAEALPAWRYDPNPLLCALLRLGWESLEEERPPSRPRSLRRLAALTAGACEDDFGWRAEAFPAFDPCAGACTLLTSPPTSVVPLRDGAELLAHGVAQHNCIPDDPSYPKRAEGGESLFLSARWSTAEGPRLATVHLVAHEGDWYLDQIAGSCNTRVPDWLGDAVERWAGGLGDAPCMADPDLGCPPPRSTEPEQLALPLRLPISPYDEPAVRGLTPDP